MAVSKNDVEYVADLAKLYFTEEEKEGLVIDLNKVLGYMEKLNELDTENTEIIVNPCYIENRYREDKIEESLELSTVIDNAPQNLEEYVLVPKVIE